MRGEGGPSKEGPLFLSACAEDYGRCPPRSMADFYLMGLRDPARAGSADNASDSDSAR
jgi:hypothetical protein